jgi:hypothetical protein
VFLTAVYVCELQVSCSLSPTPSLCPSALYRVSNGRVWFTLQSSRAWLCLTPRDTA